VSVLTDITQLDKFAVTGFPPDFPPDQRTFFSPIDDVHGALTACIAAAAESLAICMFGFDDQDLADIIKQKLESPAIAVQLSLESTQAAGVHERAILAQEDYPATVIAVGRSEKGAFMHEKVAVIDGILSITGSTNWSASAETKQDNQLTVHLGRPMAARCRARADAIHAHMLASSRASS